MAQLEAGFGVGTTTAYRYVSEVVELLGPWRLLRNPRCSTTGITGLVRAALRRPRSRSVESSGGIKG